MLQWAWVIISLNSFLQCAMIPVSFWCDGFGVVKANYTVESPCKFSNFGALNTLFYFSNMLFSCGDYASINSSGAHPPPLGNRGAFAHVVSPGIGAFAILSRPRGLGISITRGDPRAFDTRVFERQISLSGRTRPLSKTGLSIRD